MKTKRGKQAFHQGVITRNVDFWIRQFESDDINSLMANLEFHKDRFVRFGTNKVQLQAIVMILKGV